MSWPWLLLSVGSYDACIDPRDYLPKTAPELNVESDEGILLAELESNCDYSQRLYAEHILMLAKSNMFEIQWNINTPRKSAVVFYRHKGKRYPILMMSCDGVITIPLTDKSIREAIREKNMDAIFLQKLNAIPGFSIPESDCKNAHRIPLENLKHTDTIDLFFDAIDWWIQEIKKLPLAVEEKAEKEAN